MTGMETGRGADTDGDKAGVCTERGAVGFRRVDGSGQETGEAGASDLDGG